MVGEHNRIVSLRKAYRKRRIAEQMHRTNTGYRKGYYENLHQYSKDQIRYSRRRRSCKTRNKGRRKPGNYSKSVNWKASDKRKMDRLFEEYHGIGEGNRLDE